METKLFFQLEFLAKSLQEMPKSLVLFPSETFAIFIHSTFAALVQNYIQPSDLSSVLIYSKFLISLIRQVLTKRSSTYPT